MKLSVSSYSYSRTTRNDDEKAISLAAKQGFAGIEFAEIHPKEGFSKTDWARELARQADENGLEIVSYSIGGNLLAGELDKEVERLCREVDVAAALGSKRMRHDVAYGYDRPESSYMGFDNALDRLASGCRAVTEYAAGKGVVTMTENHGRFCQESARIERLVNAVCHPNFGALIDVGNFLCADDEPAAATGRLAPYAKHVHVKDFHVKSGNGFVPPDGFFSSRGGMRLRGAVIGHGDVPVLGCLRALADAGYDGWLSIEFEGMEDPETGVLFGKHSLEKMLDRSLGL
ncbi:MAG: sugar phosphate isomerase/epimerase [Clostridia bacterium]|nr:sugar phosphate isomerase/epimerase [Clostridia bacterium]